jgi:hypothetical protein
MSIVNVTDVQLMERDTTEIPEFVLNEPRTESAYGSYAITFNGHVVTREQQAFGLEFRCNGQLPVWIPLGLPRPDLADSYPDAPWLRSNGGFRAAVNSLPLPNDFTAQVYLVMRDKRRVPLAIVKGHHRSPPVHDSGVSPVMVTTLGRTGSTWVINLLSHHPEVVAYPAFKGEVRIATYWMDVMTALTNPASYLQAIRTQVAGSEWWLGKNRLFDEALDDEDTEAWFGRMHVEELVHFFKKRLDDFYLHLAERTSNTAPKYFAEKALPTLQLTLLRQLYPRLKEVFLVRDFRDMLTSILAFNRAKGVVSFGRENAASDEQYVRELLGRDVNRVLEGWLERKDTAHLLRYEDLVRDPYPTLQRLFAYLEIDPSEETVAQILTASEEKPSAGQQGHPTTSTPEESLQRWRRELTPELQAACDDAFGPALRAFGYETTAEQTVVSGGV